MWGLSEPRPYYQLDLLRTSYACSLLLCGENSDRDWAGPGSEPNSQRVYSTNSAGDLLSGLVRFDEEVAVGHANHASAHGFIVNCHRLAFHTLLALHQEVRDGRQRNSHCHEYIIFFSMAAHNNIPSLLYSKDQESHYVSW